jgi:uncharacterized protein
MDSLASASTLWWILSVAMMAIGIAGTVLPALPGVMLVFAGILLGAWIDGFTKVGGLTVAFIGLLGVAAFAVDYLAALLGARRVGASRLALIGAAVGTVLGIFTGLIGLLFMPLVGAVVGELIAQRQNGLLGRERVVDASAAAVDGPGMPGAGRRAAQVGIATWVGLMLGTVAKVVLVFMMVGIFVAALLIS